MVLSNAQQLSVLLGSLLFGVCLGAVYDLLRAFRVFVKSSAVAVLFQDLFYFLFAALASFLFIFEVNDGTVRLFILLAFFAGGMAERATVGHFFLRLCRRSKNFFSRRREERRRNKHTKRKTSQHHPSPKAGENVAQEI